MDYLTKTIQGYIKPNQTTKQQLNLISKGCNFVYNHFLSQRIECDKNKQKQPTKEQQERELVQLKKNNPLLNQVYSQILKQVVRVRVADAWNKYKEHKAINFKAKYPRLKTENRWYDSFSYTQNNGSFGIEGKQLFIKLGSAIEKSQRKLIKLQRELSRKKKGSKNYQEKKLELARKHEKISNRMKDRNHKLSRKLVDKFDLIGLEDLKSKEMTERRENQKRKVNRYLAKSIIRASWYQLAQFLSYKVKETSKKVIVVNPKNTTQRCSQCAKLANPKIERDVNAAKNILYLA